MVKPGRRARLGMLALVVVVLLGLGLQALRMHRDSGEWRLTQSPTPHRIHVDGRDYDRSNLPQVDLPSGFVADGEAKGGGTVYVPSDPVVAPGGEVVAPLIVYVQGDSDRVVKYGLVGGP